MRVCDTANHGKARQGWTFELRKSKAAITATSSRYYTSIRETYIPGQLFFILQHQAFWELVMDYVCHIERLPSSFHDVDFHVSHLQVSALVKYRVRACVLRCARYEENIYLFIVATQIM